MDPLTRWSIKFTIRHPIKVAQSYWRWRGKPRPVITVGELLPLIEQLSDALDRKAAEAEEPE